jgi:hypothetical protein
MRLSHNSPMPWSGRRATPRADSPAGQLLKVPVGVPPASVLEHARLVVACADRYPEDEADEAANEARVNRARDLLSLSQ